MSSKLLILLGFKIGWGSVCQVPGLGAFQLIVTGGVSGAGQDS